MPNSISIIIPAKNEEDNITRVLESINLCQPKSLIKEIILVDCCSSDKTLEIANNYSIKILQLKADWPHSPAAARYIGSLFTQSELIFFIDADMTLDPQFLQKAATIMDSNKNIAGVSGIAEEIYLNNNQPVGKKSNLYKTKKSIQEVKFLGGAALYRKEYLLNSGNFNPYLNAAEEIELAQRLRLNYKLISVPYPMITHYTAPINAWKEFIRKKESRLFLGIGQSLRTSNSIYFLIEKLAYYKEYLFFIILIITTFLAIILAIITKNLLYLLFSPTIILIILIFIFLRKNSFKDALLAIIKWLIISKEISLGLLTNPKDPKNYPCNPNIIKGDFHA